MTKRKRFLSILLTVLVLLSLTGCWSAQEINDMAIINTMAIDENNAGDVVLTVSIVKPNMLFSLGAGTPGNPEDSFLVNSASGKNLFDAMGKLSSVIPEKIYLGHVNAIVFGEKAAQNRMESSIDFFKRQNDFRPSIELFVTKGIAADLIKISPTLNPTLSTELHDLALNSRFSATKMLKDISQFTDDLTSNTIDPITGVINRQTEDREVVGVNSLSKKEKSQANLLYLNETAAFKGANLVGFLDPEETRGLLWIQGELKNQSIVLNCGNKNNKESVSLHVTNSSSTMVPKLINGQPKMTVNIEAKADIVEITCTDLSVDSQQLEKLNNHLEANIKQEVLKTLTIGQHQWETDIFGFGRAIYRKYPAEWDELAPKWRNGGLNSLDVDLKVSANISGIGLLKEPSKANESR